MTRRPLTEEERAQEEHEARKFWRHIGRQSDAQARAARKYGLATLAELRWAPRASAYRWDLIDRDINKLLARRRDLPAGSPAAIPDVFVNYMIGIWLNCCAAEGVPRQEICLLLYGRQHEAPSYAERRPEKADALTAAQTIKKKEPDISDRALAQRVGVDRKTIRNWKQQGHL
jgi:hypothetical protein